MPVAPLFTNTIKFVLAVLGGIIPSPNANVSGADNVFENTPELNTALLKTLIYSLLIVSTFFTYVLLIGNNNRSAGLLESNIVVTPDVAIPSLAISA